MAENDIVRSTGSPLVTKLLTEKLIEERNKTDRRQGCIAKCIDKAKSVAGYGYCAKNADNIIDEFQRGNVDYRTAEKYIKDYKYTQRDASELTLDVATGALSLGAYGKSEKLIKFVTPFIPEGNDILKHIKKYPKSIGLGIAVLTGMSTKPLLRFFDRIYLKKEEKRDNKTFWKDNLTGALDGAMAPVALLKGGLLGIPLLLGENTIQRYLAVKKDDKKSMSDFVDRQKDNLGLKAAGAGIMALKSHKINKSLKSMDEVIAKALENVKGELKNPYGDKNPISGIVETARPAGFLILKDPKFIKDILLSPKSVEEKMRLIEEKNIYLPKLIQTCPDKVLDMVNEYAIKNISFDSEMLSGVLKSLLKDGLPDGITSKLPPAVQPVLATIKQFVPEKYLNEFINSEKFNKTFEGVCENFGPKIKDYLSKTIEDFNTTVTRFKSDCPQSRTIEEAREFVAKTYGDKYTIINDKALGVGTVAETFLAKDNTTGKEVVLKFLKKGMSAEKIEKDRAEMIGVIREMYKNDTEKADFAVRKAQTLYDAWAKEVDLAKEAEAAEILGRNAKTYNAVKVIEVKDNVYVMEKAPGVQFNQFIDDMLKQNKKLTQKEISDLGINYFRVFFEQLLSVPKTGSKVMHADPHPGNIFVDIANKEKPFTFIDTGNVLRYTPEEAIENTLNHLDYFIGNTKGIAKALLRDAGLPAGMTPERAVEIVSTGLKNKVYDCHSKVFSGGNFFNNINDIGLQIMNENGIIPATNNTNLLKAELTYFSNLTCIRDIHKIIDKNGAKLKESDMEQQVMLMLTEIREALTNAMFNNKNYTAKQIGERLKYIDENKERFYSTIFSLTKNFNPSNAA